MHRWKDVQGETPLSYFNVACKTERMSNTIELTCIALHFISTTAKGSTVTKALSFDTADGGLLCEKC